MSELIGGIDDRRRPLVRVPVPGKDDLLAIVDTTFTGELLLNEDDARNLGVLMLDVEAEIELGDGSRQVVKQGQLTVAWLGADRDATVQVVPRDASRPTRRARRDGEPFALLGTELLAPNTLTVNFATGVVRILGTP